MDLWLLWTCLAVSLITPQQLPHLHDLLIVGLDDRLIHLPCVIECFWHLFDPAEQSMVHQAVDLTKSLHTKLGTVVPPLTPRTMCICFRCSIG